MAAFRCSICGINYPPDQRFARCPVHETPSTWFPGRSPDEDWQWAATAMQQGIKRGLPAQTPPMVSVSVQHREGEGYWISSHDLIREGLVERLETFSVLEIPTGEDRPQDHPCDCFWEVIAYRGSSREYWVRPLRVPNVPPA